MTSTRWRGAGTAERAGGNRSLKGPAPAGPEEAERRSEAASCRQWLNVVRPHLHAALAEPAALAAVDRAAERLPPTSLAVLEARLAETRPTVDLSVRLTRPGEALHAAHALGAGPLARFLRRWARRPSSWMPMASLWLEFDLDGWRPCRRLPRPVVCARLARPAAADRLTEHVLPAIHCGPLAPRQRRLTERLVRELPSSIRLLYAFSLRSRDDESVRLEFFCRDREELRRYLTRRHPEASSRLAGPLDLLGEVDRIHLSIDVGEEISFRYGLGGSFAGHAGREPRWKTLFQRLVAAGLCSPAKRDAIFAWPGYDSVWTAPRLWPTGGTDELGYCVRALSHVKLVVGAEPEPEAKAYLIFSPFDPAPGATT